MTTLAVVLVAAGGVGGAIQAALMGRFGERVGTLEAFAFASLLTALIGTVVLVLWLWTAAAMSALIVIGITFAAPRIGTTATIGIVVAGNLAMAAVIDRFGLFGLEKIPFHWPRLLGIVLLAVGAAMSLRR